MWIIKQNSKIMITIYYDGKYPTLKGFTTSIPCDMVTHGFVLESSVELIRDAIIKANIQPDCNTFSTHEKDGRLVLNHWKIQYNS